ncbi:MAG: DNA polymerase III subunit beta [Clostridia bacterium]|nr:DNA polymerase III subunit beta [Clostridia bacterium]
MIFHVNSKELTAGVLSVVKALPVRTTLACLEGIFFTAQKDGLHLKCSDLMLQKECIIPSFVEEEGSAIVPGKIIAEFVRKLPEGDVTFSITGKEINIICGRVNTVLQPMEYEDFPEMRFDGDHFSVKVSKDECRDMISQTTFATAQDDSKPILTGALIEINDNTITAVATDAYQFAMRKIQIESTGKEASYVIPNKALTEISHMMAESQEKEVTLVFTRTHVRVDIGHTILTARLLDGAYIDYKRILPKDHKLRVILDRNAFMDSIDRAQLVAREGGNNIILHFTNNLVKISASSYIGVFDENVDTICNGDDIDIAFNPKYVMNVLKNIDDEKICIDLLSGVSPCVIKPVQGERYYYLIVPVRIYA